MSELLPMPSSPVEREASILTIQTHLQHVVCAFVDFPDHVKVEHQQGVQMTVFTIEVDAKDIGKLIGKSGRMAESLRTFLLAISSKYRIRAVLELID